MTDEPQIGFGEGLVAGDPQPGEGVQNDAAAPDKPVYVTQAELSRIQEELRHAQNKLERDMRRMYDKKDTRLKEEVDAKLKDLEARYAAIGQTMPDGVRQKAIDETVLSYAGEDTGEPQAAEPSDPLVAYVNRKARAIQDKAGVQMEQGDPEYRSIRFDSPDPDEFIDSWTAAVTAKAARLSLQQNVSPAARAPMVGGGAPAGGDLLTEYNRRKQGLRPGSEEMLQLRREMQRKGLTDI